MKLSYIFGRSGSGKTTLILNLIAEALKNSDDSGAIIYIVPEQFSLQAEKNLLSVSGGSSVKAQVLSFARLAHQVYKKTGGVNRTILEDAGKSMLIRKIIYELSDKLLFFNKIADKDGFVQSLSSAISELYKYEVLPKTIIDCSEKINDEYFLVKMNDIVSIYTRYREYVDGNFLTADNVLSFLPKKIESFDHLKGAHIFFDGFTGFTPQEYEIIAALIKKASCVTIALTSLDNKTFYSSLEASDPFYETKSTINKLSEIAEETGAAINPPCLLNENYRFKNDALKFLERNYFTYKKIKYENNQTAVSIVKAQNKYAETEEAAKKILRLVREEDCRFNEIAVLTTSVSDYSNVIKSIFDKYGIPVFVDERIDILSNPITEAIRSMIDIAVYNCSYEPVFRFLKTDIAGVTRSEYQYLENYVLAYGIDSYKWLDLKYWQNGYKENAEAEHFIKGPFIKSDIVSARDKFIHTISPLIDISGRKQQATTFAKAVFEVIKNTQIIETLEKSDESLLLSQHKQVWNRVCALFDKFVELLGDEKLSVKEFGKIIEAGLKSCDIGIVPPSGDQVIIGDLERTRLPDVKALFILGVNDGVIPRIKEEDSIFSDAERGLLLAHGIELSPDSRKLTSKEEFIIYNALTRPSEKLLLSYQTGGMEGKTLRPSPVIAKIKNLFPSVKETEGSSEFEYTLPAPMFHETGSILSNLAKGNKPENEQIALLAWFSESEEYKEKVIKMRRILTGSVKDESLKEETVQSLYKNDIKTSVTQLQKYAECPFSYFMRYNLKAKERKVYEAKAVDIGNIFHSVFDEFYKLVRKEKLSWGTLTKEQIIRFADECFETQAVMDAINIMQSSEESKYRLNSIKSAAAKSLWALAEHLKSGEFEPIASELKFGINEPLTAIRVAINDKYAFEITGTIDRVDITSYAGNTYVKVLDYKSGSTKFDPTDIYYGRQMQLALYLKALLDNDDFKKKYASLESKILPGGIFYFNIKDPVITSEEAEESDTAMLKAFKLNGLVLKDKKVVEKMDERLPDQTGKSEIIPVEIKKDGEFSQRTEACVREQRDFEGICNFVLTKITSLGGSIIEGDIAPKPYKSKSMTTCNYCEYSPVCGFGTTDRLSRYNYANKTRGIEEIVK